MARIDIDSLAPVEEMLQAREADGVVGAGHCVYPNPYAVYGSVAVVPPPFYVTPPLAFGYPTYGGSYFVAPVPVTPFIYGPPYGDFYGGGVITIYRRW